MNYRYIAHAGIHLGRTLAGQNSLESILTASMAGFDFVEIDVRETKDGVIVAMHDETVNNTMKTKDGYRDLTDPVKVQDLTLQELKENYVFKTDNPAFRTEAPTLEECLEYCKENEIIPMIHPKISTPDFVDRVLSSMEKICGYNKAYIVSETAAVEYALSKDPDLCAMIVASDKKDVDRYSKFKNTIIAISYKNTNYDELVEYVRKICPNSIETTQNTMLEWPSKADVINYDYLAPWKEGMNVVETIEDEMKYEFITDIGYGCACLEFKLNGNVGINLCGREFFLKARGNQQYRIPVILYNQIPRYNMVGTGVSDIKFSIVEY